MDFNFTVIFPLLSVLLIGVVLGVICVIVVTRRRSASHRVEVETRLRRELSEQDRKEKIELLEEKEQLYCEHEEKSQQVQNKEKAIQEREVVVESEQLQLQQGRDELSGEIERFKQKENRVNKIEQNLGQRQNDLEIQISSYNEKLEMLSGLTTEEAREQLLERVTDDVKGRYASIIRAERLRMKEDAEREGKKIIAMAIQRCVVDEAMQVTTSSVTLPNEGIKSRIIGKEGRNVRTFETVTGVKVVVDDTPETVLLSSYDPLRRELARRSMTKLIQEGGFTPNRIEDVVEQCRKALDQEMISEGKKALVEIKATRYHKELPYSVGMLKYRASYGQNLLQHCLEVAHLSGLMAAELRLDVRLARRAGLLHDIGKTVSREMEGSHVELGIQLGERFDEHPIVREAIAEHHEDNERMSAIGFLVKAADTISSIRPGGRREDLEGYAQRIMRLEEVANSFSGVRDVYAINAGREIRVMVKGDQVNDENAEILAFEIANRVKNELTFAGEVKVMVVRETRAIRHTGQQRRGRNHRSNGNGRRSGARRNGAANRRKKPVPSN